MGFLERARSQRGRHQRAKSSKSNEPTPQTSSSQPKHSVTKSKRKSIFPGLSANNTVTTTCEGSRSRSRSVNKTAQESKVDGKATPQEVPIATPFNMHYKAGNESFRFPSPALVNNAPRGSPLTSIAHLPPIANEHSPPVTAAPQNQSTARPPNWGRSVTDPTMSTTVKEAAPTQATTWDCEQDMRQRPQVKKQKSAWKTLGSLFKGKQTRQPIPDQFYQIQPPSDDALASTQKKPGKVGVLDSPLPSPGPADEYATKRVDSGRTIQEPSGQNGTDDLLTPTPANFDRKRSNNSSRPTKALDDGTGNNSGSMPQLDISIPDAGFERYSVMFEKLLEPKVPLIERRQSKRMNVEASKANDGTTDAEPLRSATSLQRSMTSPSLKRIPSLSIHIAHSNRADRTKDTYQGPMAHRPRPPKRSRTLPSAAQSPVVGAASFNSTTPVTAKAIPLPKRNAPTTKTTASSPTSPCSIVSENSLPPTPTTATSLASSIETTIFGPSPPKPKVASATASSSSLPPPPPPIPTRSAERLAGPHAFNRQIVQVSVARQVSVSKARRRVADAVEAKQPLRPRVVELGKNRKSTLVLIEGGD